LRAEILDEEARSRKRIHSAKPLRRLEKRFSGSTSARAGLQPRAVSQACEAFFMLWNGLLRGFST